MGAATAAAFLLGELRKSADCFTGKLMNACRRDTKPLRTVAKLQQNLFWNSPRQKPIESADEEEVCSLTFWNDRRIAADSNTRGGSPRWSEACGKPSPYFEAVPLAATTIFQSRREH